MTTAPPGEDRSELWLALLRRLTAASPSWAVHGEVAEGFAGTGDVDLVAPAEELARVEHEFRTWASHSGLGPVVSCRHRPGALILVTPGPTGTPLFELEVRYERYFKGWTAWRAEDLAPVAVMHADGYRCLRPGAAGLLKLVPNGLRPGGRPKWSAAKRERVAERLRRDPEGVQMAAALFGRARRAVSAGADSVAAGGWDRRAMVAAEMWALAYAAAEGRGMVARARFRARGDRRCLVLSTIGDHDRVIEGDPARWLALVAEDHTVTPAPSPQ